jgi:hypothetical protein
LRSRILTAQGRTMRAKAELQYARRRFPFARVLQ